MTDLKHEYDVVVVGGGASGIVAAIAAAGKGASVLLAEKMQKLGKKILASGGGRCNLSNDKVNASFYNREAKSLIDSALGLFGEKEIIRFFNEIGLYVVSEGGKIYPVTNQAVSVMDVLEMELARLGVDTKCQCEVTGISAAHDKFKVTLKPNRHVIARSVVVSGGGKSYPALGSDGSAYAFAARFGHKLIEPVPSTVPLMVKDPWCHVLQGQKIKASAKSIIDGKKGTKIEGELLFTQYGLSGTVILDVSEDISIAFNRQRMKNVLVSVDLLPSVEEEDLIRELSRRFEKKIRPEKVLIGLLPHKFSLAMAETLKTRDAAAIAKMVKDKRFTVIGTRGWNEAEFTAGGIDTGEVDHTTLESKLHRGLYFPGEILNVQGRRGGYNLAWAWASGFLAGQAAALRAGR